MIDREKQIKKRKSELEKLLLSFGFVKGKTVKEHSKIYFNTWISGKEVCIYIVNLHNNYIESEILKDLSKRLIDNDYEIKMLYPCYVIVTGSQKVM